MGIRCYFYLPNEKGVYEKVVDKFGYEDYANEVDYEAVKELSYLGYSHPNVTHNLAKMARAGKAPCYKAVWHPEELKNGEPLIANELLGYLKPYYEDLIKNPNFYKQYDSPNGWGTYSAMCLFVNGLIGVCRKYPNALYEPSI